MSTCSTSNLNYPIPEIAENKLSIAWERLLDIRKRLLINIGFCEPKRIPAEPTTATLELVKASSIENATCYLTTLSRTSNKRLCIYPRLAKETHAGNLVSNVTDTPAGFNPFFTPASISNITTPCSNRNKQIKLEKDGLG